MELRIWCISIPLLQPPRSTPWPDPSLPPLEVRPWFSHFVHMSDCNWELCCWYPLIRSRKANISHALMFGYCLMRTSIKARINMSKSVQLGIPVNWSDREWEGVQKRNHRTRAFVSETAGLEQFSYISTSQVCTCQMIEIYCLKCKFNTPALLPGDWEKESRQAVPFSLKLGHVSIWLIIHAYTWRWIAKLIIDRESVLLVQPLVVRRGSNWAGLCVDGEEGRGHSLWRSQPSLSSHAHHLSSAREYTGFFICHPETAIVVTVRPRSTRTI